MPATMYTKLSVGSFTSWSSRERYKDPCNRSLSGGMNTRSIVAGAALVFGDTLSLSYGEAL